MTYRLVLCIDLLIGAVELIQLLGIMRISLHLVPLLHLALCMIHKECAQKYPEHKGDKSGFDHNLNIGRMEVVDIDDVEYSNDKDNVCALSHELLERVLECLVQPKE